ncbi:hypothetical protein KDA_61910 [Dictyobacter alpinus]|uniref:Uncharacterized protein n=1 Tax=Dictyobacter alpinus TaxID=2014873 RepID=A0A402BHH6_9CHLR|nr:hypothetical protein [Dictyobacter alpinus]GCE30707.1 hypothetical protein KDA_61910 [Dictyobacter alpinus]
MKAPMLFNRRVQSVLISHLLNPYFTGCLTDQQGEDIYQFGGSELS